MHCNAQGMKPVTPRASAAPPGADSAQSGIARMLPAAMVSKRFQQLFKGKGKGAIISCPPPVSKSVRLAMIQT